MKTTKEIALKSLEEALVVLEGLDDWSAVNLHAVMNELIGKLGIKNGQMLWPLRTALSGEQYTPGGAFEIGDILGKTESLRRIAKGIQMLKA